MTIWRPARTSYVAMCFGIWACGASRPSSPPSEMARARSPEPAPAPKLSDSTLHEEALGDGQPPETKDEGSLPPEIAAPTEPAPILAAIGPKTPPAVAASLRLTEEGRQHFSQKDARGALDLLEKAIKLDPTNGRAYYWLAQVHFSDGRYDQAAAFADKAGLLLATSDPVWASQAYAFKGMVFEQVGRYGDARTAYQRAVALSTSNVAAQAGVSRLTTGDLVP